MYKCRDNVVITIGRTFGSGGREIGKKVAKELGLPFYDKELLEIAAKESGGAFFTDYLSEFDEKKVSTLLYSMALNPYTGENAASLELVAQNILSKAIRMVASQSSCVIVGRRADKILRFEYDTLSVFISSEIQKRINRVSKRNNLPEKDCRRKILKADKSRRAFYNAAGDGVWGEADNYNLCIDSGDLGIDNSANMIINYLQLKRNIVEC